MRRHMMFLSIAILAVFAALMASGCCSVAGLLESDGDGSSTGDIVEEPSLDAFLDADSKTGEYETHTVWANGESYDQSGEFWVDGRKFRYDIYEDGTLVRSIISPDGQAAYFVQHETQVCEPSVASVDHYLMKYFMPDAEGVEDGTDEETGATRVVYSVKMLDDLEGSSNPWYSEDITYLVEDDVVIGVILRGTVPEDDGSIGPLDVSRELWSNVKAGARIPSDTFELPYPVQEAE